MAQRGILMMKKLMLAVIAGTTALTMSTSASATTLFDQTNVTTQGLVSQTFSFAGLTNQTSLSFAGYNVPSFSNLSNIIVQLNGAGANLLNGNYTLTPAASGSLASQSGNNLTFGGITAGSYDTYSTQFASTAGSLYTLRYDLSASGTSNGLRVTTTGGVAGAVPEPATWAMMILGMGAVGFAMRRRKNVTMTVRFA
jgi:hypothetical protein